MKTPAHTWLVWRWTLATKSIDRLRMAVSLLVKHCILRYMRMLINIRAKYQPSHYEEEPVDTCSTLRRAAVLSFIFIVEKLSVMHRYDNEF
jgi:hypothetical protein